MLQVTNKQIEVDVWLEINVPESGGAIVIRRIVLDTEQLHDKTIDLDISKSVHHVGIIRSGMPSLVRPAQRTFSLRLVQTLDYSRERTVSNKHGLHGGFSVIKAVVLQIKCKQ